MVVGRQHPLFACSLSSCSFLGLAAEEERSLKGAACEGFGPPAETRETLDLSSVGSYRGWSTHVEQEGEGCQEGVAPTGSGCPSSTCCACGTRRTPRHAARTPAARARERSTQPPSPSASRSAAVAVDAERARRAAPLQQGVCGSRTCQRRGRCSCSPARNSLLGSWLSRAEVPHGIVSRRTCSPMNPTLCTAPSKSVLVRGRYALF